MRRSIERLVIDWAPVKPSISGSMISGTRSPPMGRLALEKRVLAALSSACSKAMGVGGGAGGGVGACASAGESARPEARARAPAYLAAYREMRAI